MEYHVFITFDSLAMIALPPYGQLESGTIDAMAKKTSAASNEPQKRTQARWKQAVPKTPEQVRDYARELEAIARKLHRVADDMQAIGLSTLEPITQGLETAIANVDEKVEVEFEQRFRKATRRNASKAVQQYKA